MLKNTVFFALGFVTACAAAVGGTKLIAKHDPDSLDQAANWYKS